MTSCWKDKGFAYVMSSFHGSKMDIMNQFLQSKYVHCRTTVNSIKKS